MPGDPHAETDPTRRIEVLAAARPTRPEDRERARATGAPADWRPPVGPPGSRSLLTELSAVREPLRLAARAPRLVRAPRGDGGPVVTIPGYGSGPTSMRPVTAFLRRLGHAARTWPLGRNTGHPERDRDLLLPLLDQLADDEGPVALVGWSLGGTIAREVARSLPDAIRTVVTYGTPAVGGPTFTAAGAAWDADERRRILETVDRLDLTDPIGVPITAIVSRRDGIVDWRAQVDVRSPQVTHVEVASTHFGLGIDPDVWEAVATALAPGRGPGR